MMKTSLLLICQYAPWQSFVRDKQGKVVDYQGFMFLVLEQISYKLNFTFRVSTPEDGEWGDNVNGKWTGMIRQVMDKEVHLAAAAFATTLDRMEVVGFTEPVDLHPYGFMYKKQSRVGKDLLLLKPFTWEVWLALLSLSIIIGPLFYIVHRLIIFC